MTDQTSLCDVEEGQQHSLLSTEVRSQSLDWIISIKERLSVLCERSLKSSIFKVPNKLYKIDENSYSPRIVSIGPYHSSTSKKHDDMLTTDEHKWWYTLYLLKRTSNLKEILVQCSKAMLELEKKVRRRYAENIELEAHQLAEVMLIDGCFMLELFLRSSLRDFTEEDPIFHNAWMVPTLRHDLALLENQIPFFILEELFNIAVRLFSEHLPCSIIDLALSFFYPDLNLSQEAIRKKCSQNGTHSHLLDLLHNFYLPESPEASNSKGKETRGFRICATRLLEAGIEFEKGKVGEDHLLDITFSKDKGVITIPPLRIDETKKSLLRNLIAFEQCLGSTQQHITSYAILMKSLIQSSQDIDLLEKKDIIKNELGKVEDVLSLFNNILREVVPKDFYFGKLCEDVNAYQQSLWQWHRLMAILMVRWHRYIAVLKSNYFATPWSFLSFMAALVLLILTIVQTYYAVRSQK